jgi:8-oxo-dGTP diphosphatase
MPSTTARRTIVISTLVVIENGRMLLVRKEGATAFILPGGKIEPGETMEQAVRREVREELGCDIVGLGYAATFRDEAADATDLEVEVHVHVGHLASVPETRAEIREMTWCSVETPEVPVAPSLSRQILPYFRGPAAVNARLTEALVALRERMGIGEYADRHVYDCLIAAGVALGEISPADEPMRRILMPIETRTTLELAKKRREIDQLDRDALDRAKWAQRDPDRSQEDRQRDEGYEQRRQKERAGLQNDVARGEDVVRRLGEDPLSLLLPLGTSVRIRPFETTPGAWPLPVAGTTGVVVGYSSVYGRPNVVAFPQDVVETGGDTVLFDEEEANRYHQVNYLPEELEILSYGQLVDGTPVDRPGWWPTHSHHDKESILYSESMVVRADGRLWRIQPCSGPPECTQITLDTPEGRDSFDHLIPLERA